MTDFRRTIVAGSVPLVFGVGFVQLGRLFDYPQILRQSSEMILERFQANESIIAPWWWLMFVAALAFIPVSVAVVRWSGLLGTQRAVATAVGIASGLVQALGLSRWVFAVPLLAERAADPSQAKTASCSSTSFMFGLVWVSVSGRDTCLRPSGRP
ncbi:MAG: DUF4386 family protein [Fimbriimonas sp.]